MKRIILLILTCGFLLSCTAQENEAVSGTLRGGLRYLSVDSGTDKLNYTVYRGDYIVFEIPEGTRRLSLPDLEIDLTLPRPEGERPYVKMKEAGAFPFTLGERTGTMRVIELTEAHYSELTAAEAAAFIEQTEPFILDVRTEGEYRMAHISQSELIPVQILTENLDKLSPYKDRDILIYCASGNRSTVASRLLIDAGFTRIYNLRYGIGDWMNRGYPVE
ncbi:MAG: rhodanese-like domain-containing protein [Spirochaetales bacterium]|nr:rhodanese-like domain-containing protein [Spirochaetales bacterium]